MNKKEMINKILSLVLILVLLEYALWEVINFNEERKALQVLILVLLEYALWVTEPVVVSAKITNVLILVLLEYALWVWEVRTEIASIHES